MKKAVVILIFLVMVFNGEIFAQTAADFNVELTDDGQGVRIKGYTGTATAVKIPDTIEGIPVKEIGAGAFAGGYDTYSKITSVTFPVGLVKIGARAFQNCANLTSVVIPDSVTVIGNEAFADCYRSTYDSLGKQKQTGLTSVTLPKNLTTLERGDLNYDTRGIFGGCKLLTSVTFTGTALKVIPENMFLNTGLTTIVIPEGVTQINGPRPDMVLYSEWQPTFPSTLTSITLPSTLTVIGTDVFSGTKLKTIVIPDNVTRIGDMAFANCTELTSVTLGVGIKYIGSKAFSGCSSLAAITIPDSVTVIKNFVVDYDRRLLTELSFNSGFEGCGKLGIAAQAALKRRGYTGSF